MIGLRNCQRRGKAKPQGVQRLNGRATWLLTPAGQRADGGWIADTLRDRALERGLLRYTPLVTEFARQRVEICREPDVLTAVNRLYGERGWTDGLPIVPPTIGRVESIQRFVTRNARESLGPVDPLGGEAIVEKIAANAVMAGCRPCDFPVVLTAVEALLEPDFNLRGVQTTDENVAPVLLVGGPVVDRLGINGEFGVFGPGRAANATIGRAIRLVMHNLGGGWPGAVSFAGLGQAARYTMCMAEDESRSPWPPFRTEAGFAQDDNCLTLLRAETVMNVTGDLAAIASVMGSAASIFTMRHGGTVTVVIAPYVARLLAAEGYDKDKVRAHLHRHGRMPIEAWHDSWLYKRIIGPEDWPAWVKESATDGLIPAVETADDITVLVAGGDVEIPQCAYLPGWGFPPCRITKAIAATADWLDA